jgi:hypothetical protein
LDRAIDLYEQKLLEMPPFLVTNGKITHKAHRLLDYIEAERPVSISLSQDQFHDPIDPSVVRRFKEYDKRTKRWRSYSYGPRPESIAEIRSVQHIMPVGRAVEMQVFTEPLYEGWGQCVCDDPLVDPEGVVWSCGCKTHKLGTVWDEDVLLGYDREYAHTGGEAPPDE